MKTTISPETLKLLRDLHVSNEQTVNALGLIERALQKEHPFIPTILLSVSLLKGNNEARGAELKRVLDSGDVELGGQGR